MLERVLVCLLAQGHLLIEGVPGLAKTLTIKTTAGVLGGIVRARPVHARPRSLRPRRHAHLPRRGRDVRHRARPRLLQLPARGRDQPRAREGAVRAARGHAGAPGHDRPRDAPRPGAVPRDGDAEPDRVRGHVPAPGGADRPLHAQGRDRLPAARRGADGRPAPARRRSRSSGRCSRSSELEALQRAVHDIYVDPSLVSYAVDIATATRDPAGARPADLAQYISYGASPRGPISLVQGARALALVRGREYALVEDLQALARDALRHRLVLSYQALAEEVSSRRDPRPGARRRPRPAARPRARERGVRRSR